MHKDIFCSKSHVPISVPALFVRGLPQDFIGGKAINKINIRVILDDDPDICGLYPLTKEKEQHYQESIEFISEHMDLFYLQTEEMYWTRFKKKILLLMYSTINVRNGIQATPRGRRLYRAGVGFELAIKRLPARCRNH